MSTHPSVIARASRADIRTDPYPHLVLKDALPASLFAQLERSYPDIERVAGPGPLEGNTLYLKSIREVLADPGTDPAWRSFFEYHSSREFFLEVLELWGEVLAQAYPGLAEDFGKPAASFSTGLRYPHGPNDPRNLEHDIQLDCQFGMNSAVRNVGRVRGPHADTIFKLFAGLVYFRRPEDDSTGGELQFYRYKNPRHRFDPRAPVDPAFVERAGIPSLKEIDDRLVEAVEAVPYEPNTLVMWVNTPHSIHGVSPRSVTEFPRRYVNLLGECYAARPEGFFAKGRKQPWWKTALRSRRPSRVPTVQ